jgi:hypothetical protein
MNVIYIFTKDLQQQKLKNCVYLVIMIIIIKIKINM